MKKFHNEPYSEETLVKLGIFRDYLRSWLPVFINTGKTYWHKINIVDFFAGQGCDVNGVSGSSLIIFEELQPYLKLIKQKGISVNIILNEKEKELFDLLEDNITKYRNHESYFVKTENKDFHETFVNHYYELSNLNSANLVFLDQFGIKQIDSKTFEMLIKLKRTDFLFFISSSIVNRFIEKESINKHLQIDKDEIDKLSYNYIHKIVYDYYKKQIKNENYFLAPFSIKKTSNIYGLIFGSNHPLGMEKFLNTAWKYDKQRGEANFDIDSEKLHNDQLDLFTGEINKSKKVELYEDELVKRILNGEISTNKDVYLFTLNEGFIPKHSRKVLKDLHKQKKIDNLHLHLSHKCCLPNSALEKIILL